MGAGRIVHQHFFDFFIPGFDPLLHSFAPGAGFFVGAFKHLAQIGAGLINFSMQRTMTLPKLIGIWNKQKTLYLMNILFCRINSFSS
jgi:hypothetical protein